MKICVDCRLLSESNGGIASYFRPLLRRYINDFPGKRFVLFATGKDIGFSYEHFSNVELKIIPKKSGKLSKILIDFFIYPFLLMKERGDFLISPYYDFRVPFYYANRSVITLHDLCYWDLKELYPNFTRFYYRFLFNLNLLLVKNVITVSEYSFNRIKESYGNRLNLKIVYNTYVPVKNENEYINIKNDILKLGTKVLLYTGGIDVKKNIENLIAGFRECKKVETDLVLVITGNAKDNEIYQDAIKNWGDEGIYLTGRVSNEELYYLYNEVATAVVSLSTYEGFGRSCLEAKYFRLPLLCSDIPIFKEVVGDYATYCDPLNLKEIKESMLLVSHCERMPEDEQKDFRFSFENVYASFVSVMRGE